MQGRYQSHKTGLLITNLGTPDAPTPAAVRRYLAEFLADRRVVEIPKPLWWLILHGIILRVRPRQSAKLYQNIWHEDGSPLLLNTKHQAQALAKRLHDIPNIEVAYGMRYGQPSIASAIEKLKASGITRLLVLPLYPQYCAATTGSTFDCVSNTLQQMRWLPELRMINGYCDHTGYITALANSVRESWRTRERGQKLVISFHGIPQRNFEKGDPYYCYCHKTARLLAEQLELPQDEWMLVFQSRFGRAAWLQPYCLETLEAMPAEGITSVDVICPGFSSDCLETLEEIAMTNKEAFIEAGGKDYHYIPALNANNDHIDALESLVRANLWEVVHETVTA